MQQLTRRFKKAMLKTKEDKATTFLFKRIQNLQDSWSSGRFYCFPRWFIRNSAGKKKKNQEQHKCGDPRSAPWVTCFYPDMNLHKSPTNSSCQNCAIRERPFLLQPFKTKDRTHKQKAPQTDLWPSEKKDVCHKLWLRNTLKSLS